MKLTSTSNKQLAEAVKVDPSLISLLRTGRRDAPRNVTHVKAMATYFSKKCEGNYQRIALSEALGRQYLQVPMDTERLATILLEWLTDGRDQVGQFLNTFERFSLEAHGAVDVDSAEQEEHKFEQPNSAYFGNEGKRGAISAFISLLLSLDTPGTVLLTSDESIDWLYEDTQFAEKLKEQVLTLLQKGFRICRIAPPIISTEQAFDTVSQYIPLYLTGQVESYYYPRLRDSVYRRTLLILPDVASVVSTSISGQSISRATVFTQKKRLANAHAAEFRDFLAKCSSMLTTYSTYGNAEELLRCILQFEADHGNRIQQSTSLSSITAPSELIRLSAQGLPDDEAEKIISAMNKAQDMFRQSLDDYEIIDIHSVATAKEVRSGKINVSSGYLNQKPPIQYTPETYVLHLQNILSLMEQHENYRAVLRPLSDETHALMVKDGRQAILIRPGTPLTVFEISQPYIAEACREYLSKLIKTHYSPEIQRQNTLSQLRQLIAQLSDES